ncbi:cytoskeleton-associated protein 2-like isoform X2 [Dendronephthya gigantea]|uniref:cytoskeleton-associated protein 2-like isoform X2 n=1 Tax=Dendronephthya gigantea TaxID=151771 RepID=UPI001069C3D6|nr:cytoskeleton-associated protein 2-like isoform X2 [Dendronephthya gigantea]
MDRNVNRPKHWQSNARRKNLAEKKAFAETNKMPSYQNKSLDMSVRLQLWKTEKIRKEQSSKEKKKLKQTNSKTILYYTGSKSNIPLTKTTKFLNKKFKTPLKEYQSPSIKDTYKDVRLDMRTRLELWWKEKGKTPQTPTLSNQGFPCKHPVGASPNQRRKTWCHNEMPRSKSVQNRKSLHRQSGIFKHGELSGKQTRKSCSFILQNKENETNENNSSTDSFMWCSDKVSLAADEEKDLIKTLERCYEMFKENLTQEEIAFRLDDIQREHPNALRHALYWICRAKLAENFGDHERVVCNIERATAFSAEPKQIVEKYFAEYKSKAQRDNEGAESPAKERPFRTPYRTPCRELSKLDGEVFNSSVVRFCLIDSTPRRNRKSAPEKRVFTPVRRTTRWERCGITRPKMIEEKRITVASLGELSSPIRSTIVFKPNMLLPCQLDEEMLIDLE